MFGKRNAATDIQRPPMVTPPVAEMQAPQSVRPESAAPPRVEPTPMKQQAAPAPTPVKAPPRA